MACCYVLAKACCSIWLVNAAWSGFWYTSCISFASSLTTLHKKTNTYKSFKTFSLYIRKSKFNDLKETQNSHCHVVLRRSLRLICKSTTAAIMWKVCAEMWAGITRFSHLYAVGAQASQINFPLFRGEVFFSQDTDCSGQSCEMGQHGIIYRMVPFSTVKLTVSA